MDVAGAVDSVLVGEDVGKVCNMEEPLEIPIISDLTMVLGSISQSKAVSVVIDFIDLSTVYDNVKQAMAFGMRSVVYVPRISVDTVTTLSSFCEKASMVSLGLSCCADALCWFCTSSTSHYFSLVPLQKCRDC
ncbi:dihydrodipicolinate reductase-like protein CRR1, chloroplastic isoform X2 [Magnolia sinica]|uniref:dihydrodipicolinate reductase-like protein CRR1, chloroplastic isoform X2 n=1 Tax=Magnolia sinica TaxID=86752 RepID=UPI00265A9CBC|nr:dihydrodipicolinate reductase-like protein CRR1, chloroplastic isoform X2 [Magnolia sinica]